MTLEAIDRLSDRDFHRLADFIQSYSGIKMPPTKKSMVEGRLKKRVHAVGLRSLSEYCEYLFVQGGIEAESVNLIDAVSTNKTDFFREQDHFNFLVEQAVPDLLASGMVNRSSPLKVWSAAASIGAEAYTIAMVMSEAARGHPGLRTQIVASDICTEVLETAIEGIYPTGMMAPVPEAMRRRYVMRGRGAMQGKTRIVPELRSMVTFKRVNLMEHPYPVERDMHVIFCRNILIYFDRDAQSAVLAGLCAHLRPGGYLFLGHSETMAGFDLPLHPVSATVFQRERS